MKTQEEIEQLAEIAFKDELIKSNQNINWIGYGKGIDGTSKERWIELWIKGYTKCQEDMADTLLILAYNLMSDMGFDDYEIEELSEKFNDDLAKVYDFLKAEVSSHYSDDLFNRYEALLIAMKPFVNNKQD